MIIEFKGERFVIIKETTTEYLLRRIGLNGECISNFIYLNKSMFQ